MPIYEYICRKCGNELEKLQKLSEPPLTDCPACGEETLKRKISPAGFRLAGGGWYETDFKSEGKRNLAGDRAGDGADGKGKDKGESAAAAGDKGGKKTDKKNGASGTPTSTDAAT